VTDALLTVNETADFLKVNRAKVYALMRAGALPWVMVGARRRIRMEDLEAYLASAA